jgi:hypothetical protein
MKKSSFSACLFYMFFVVFLCQMFTAAADTSLKETLSIYFNEEKVGYEEYTWTSDAEGFHLYGQGRIDKPIPIVIESVEIHLDTSFIPLRYIFKGTISGVRQEIRSEFADGEGINRIAVAGQVQESLVSIKRDAFLLPNPLFSPYVVITKKFGCSVLDEQGLSAYIIPQSETPFLLQPKEEDSCVLLLTLSTTQIEIRTDEKGDLISIAIPSQGLRITRD